MVSSKVIISACEVRVSLGDEAVTTGSKLLTRWYGVWDRNQERLGAHLPDSPMKDDRSAMPAMKWAMHPSPAVTSKGFQCPSQCTQHRCCLRSGAVTAREGRTATSDQSSAPWP